MDASSGYSLSDIAWATRGNMMGGYGCGYGYGGLNELWPLLLLFDYGRNRNNEGCVTESGLCNSMNFNNLQNSVGRLGDQMNNQSMMITNGLSNIGYTMLEQFGNMGSKVDNCCCTTQRAIDGVNYNGALNTATIISAVKDAIGQFRDEYRADRSADMQATISDLRMQLYTKGLVKYADSMTYNAGGSPFCGNGCQGNCGF